MRKQYRVKIPLGNSGELSIIGNIAGPELTKVTFWAKKIWLDVRVLDPGDIEIRIRQVIGGDCILTWNDGKYPEATIIFVLTVKTNTLERPVINERRLLEAARRKLNSVLQEVQIDNAEYDRGSKEARGY